MDDSDTDFSAVATIDGLPKYCSCAIDAIGCSH
jgi:hypothetical protein